MEPNECNGGGLVTALTDSAAMAEYRIDAASHNGTIVLHVQGALVSTTTPGLRADLASVVGHRRVLFELSGVSFIDAAGLGALIGAIRRIHEGRGVAALCGARPSILAVLRSAGMERLVHVADSPADAVAWLAAQAGTEEGLAVFYGH